jgi:hypothetical protein
MPLRVGSMDGVSLVPESPICFSGSFRRKKGASLQKLPESARLRGVGKVRGSSKVNRWWWENDHSSDIEKIDS